MANILLINPPFTKEESFARGAKYVGSLLPPLGIAYIAAMLEKHNHNVRIIDGIAEGLTIQEIVSRLNDCNIVGLTANSSFAFRVKQTAAAIKQKNPNIIIIGGGSHAHTIPLDLLKTKNIDFTAIGEAEYTFVELADQFDKDKTAVTIKEEKKIKGLAFLDKQDTLVKTESRPLIQNLDEIPYPARHLLPMQLYKTSEARSNRQPSHSMITSRGCPFPCTFCYQDLYGKTYRHHSTKRVVDEMEILIHKYGAKEISFWDDNFTFKQDRVIEICKEIKKRGISIPWNCESRADELNPDMLKEMASAGCDFIAIGVETGSARMLQIIKKNVTKEQILSCFKMVRDAGIKTRAYCMLGLYDEKLEDMEQTIEFAKELDPDVIGFTLYTPFPGTVDYKRAIEDGSLQGTPYWETQNVPEFNFLENPVYTPKHVTSEQLMKMHKKAIRSFYFRPKYVLRQFSQIRNLNDIKRLYYGARAILNGT